MLSEDTKRKKIPRTGYLLYEAESGSTFAGVADVFDTCEQTVRNRVQNYELGIDGLRDLSGRGAKPIVDHGFAEK